MSNRRRRKQLFDYQLRAIVASDIGVPDESETLEPGDFIRWIRSAFRSISRPSLRFSSNNIVDQGLIDIQARNGARCFNLLLDDVEDLPDYCHEFDHWESLIDHYNELIMIIDDARDLFKPLRRISRCRFDWDMWEYFCNEQNFRSPELLGLGGAKDPAGEYLIECHDYPAWLYRDAKEVLFRGSAIRQHTGGNFDSYTAFSLLRVCGNDRYKLKDEYLYALLAIERAVKGARKLVSIPVGIYEEMQDAGLDVDDQEAVSAFFKRVVASSLKIMPPCCPLFLSFDFPDLDKPLLSDPSF